MQLMGRSGSVNMARSSSEIGAAPRAKGQNKTMGRHGQSVGTATARSSVSGVGMCMLSRPPCQKSRCRFVPTGHSTCRPRQRGSSGAEMGLSSRRLASAVGRSHGMVVGARSLSPHRHSAIMERRGIPGDDSETPTTRQRFKPPPRGNPSDGCSAESLGGSDTGDMQCACTRMDALAGGCPGQRHLDRPQRSVCTEHNSCLASCSHSARQMEDRRNARIHVSCFRLFVYRAFSPQRASFGALAARIHTQGPPMAEERQKSCSAFCQLIRLWPSSH